LHIGLSLFSWCSNKLNLPVKPWNSPVSPNFFESKQQTLYSTTLTECAIKPLLLDAKKEELFLLSTKDLQEVQETHAD